MTKKEMIRQTLIKEILQRIEYLYDNAKTEKDRQIIIEKIKRIANEAKGEN